MEAWKKCEPVAHPYGYEACKANSELPDLIDMCSGIIKLRQLTPEEPDEMEAFKSDSDGKILFPIKAYY